MKKNYFDSGDFKIFHGFRIRDFDWSFKSDQNQASQLHPNPTNPENLIQKTKKIDFEPPRAPTPVGHHLPDVSQPKTDQSCPTPDAKTPKFEMEVFHTSPEFEAFKGTINDSEIYTHRAIYLTGFVSSNVITVLKINSTCKNCKIDIYARIELRNSEKFPENSQKKSDEGQNFVFQLQSKIEQGKPEKSDDEMFPAGEPTPEFLTIITFGEIFLKNLDKSTIPNPDDRQKFLAD
jgi:hypothetical protein